MANELPKTAAEVAQCLQDATRAREGLELEGLVALAGMLRARRNALARAVRRQPKRRARREAQIDAISTDIADADTRVVARAVEIKSRPVSPEGVSLWGRTVDDRGAPVPRTTVAVLGPGDTVTAWTASDIGGWYALAVEDAQSVERVQLSDARGTVVAEMPIEGLAPGDRRRADFTVPRAKSTGTAPPQDRRGPTDVAEPVGVAEKRRTELTARRTELTALRDAKSVTVEQRTAAVAALDERKAELAEAATAAAASVKKARAKVTRSQTALRKAETELAGQESPRTAAALELAKQRDERAAALSASEQELAAVEADQGRVAEAATELAAQADEAHAALARAKEELAAADAELRDVEQQLPQ